MFFTPKKEEIGAQSMFRKNCVTRGLEIKVSEVALIALKKVAEAALSNNDTEIGERDTNTLQRRGLIRVTDKGEIIVTQLGVFVLALAEAGGLVTVKSKSGMPRLKAAA